VVVSGSCFCCFPRAYTRIWNRSLDFFDDVMTRSEIFAGRSKSARELCLDIQYLVLHCIAVAAYGLEIALN